VVTTGAIRRAKLVKMSPPTNQHPVSFTGRTPFLSPNQKRQSSEWKAIKENKNQKFVEVIGKAKWTNHSHRSITKSVLFHHLKRVDGSRPRVTKSAVDSQIPHVNSEGSFEVGQRDKGILFLTSLLHYHDLQQQITILFFGNITGKLPRVGSRVERTDPLGFLS